MFTAFERRWPFWSFKAPALMFALVIFGMSSLPGYALPDQPFWSFDKLVHMCEFGLFGILVYRAFRFPQPVRRPYLVTVIAGTLYAASDEFHQLFVPGRSSDIRDFAVDVLGLALFAGISAHLHRGRDTGGNVPNTT